MFFQHVLEMDGHVQLSEIEMYQKLINKKCQIVKLLSLQSVSPLLSCNISWKNIISEKTPYHQPIFTYILLNFNEIYMTAWTDFDSKKSN